MTVYHYFTATSLDGFLADEHDSLDWLLSQPTGEKSILPYEEFIAGIGAIVTGRSTYQWVRDHSETVDGAWVFTQPTFLVTLRRPASAATGRTPAAGHRTPGPAHRW